MRKGVLVTGASQGIGAATAVTFAAAGDDVLITYNENLEAANEVVRECNSKGVTAKSAKMDQANEASIDRALKQFRSFHRSHPLRTVVLNAGVHWEGSFGDMSVTDIHRLVDVNIKGTTILAQELAKLKPETMIIVGSELSLRAKKNWIVYCMTKAATRMLVQCLAIEVGFNVFCVNPDATKTKMAHFNGRDTERVAKVITETARSGYGKPSGSDINVWEIL
jgi:3-oxoacyl-[acyl-carrier protein] reductase